MNFELQVLPLPSLWLKLLKTQVGSNLVDDGLDKGIHLGACGVVRLADIVHTIVTNEGIHLTTLVLVLGVIDRNGVTAVVLH